MTDKKFINRVFITAFNKGIEDCKQNVKLKYETYLDGETSGVNISVDLDSLEKLKK